jgi:hypothetical protein
MLLTSLAILYAAWQTEKHQDRGAIVAELGRLTACDLINDSAYVAPATNMDGTPKDSNAIYFQGTNPGYTGELRPFYIGYAGVYTIYEGRALLAPSAYDGTVSFKGNSTRVPVVPEQPDVYTYVFDPGTLDPGSYTVEITHEARSGDPVDGGLIIGKTVCGSVSFVITPDGTIANPVVTDESGRGRFDVAY